MRTSIAILALFALASALDAGRSNSLSEGSHEHRNVELHVNNDGVAFSSVAGSPGPRGKTNRVQFRLESEGDSPLRIRFMFFGDKGDTKSQLNFMMRFVSLIEFAETSPHFDGYNASVDKAEQTIQFSGKSWAFSQQPDQTQADGSTLYTFTVDYTGTPGVFQFVCKLSTAQFTCGNKTCKPEAVKIDIHIPNFPFAKNNTHLALQAKMQTAHMFRHHGNDSQIINKDVVGEFAWESTLSINGAAAHVVASDWQDTAADSDSLGNKGESAKQICFSFNGPNPKNIVWDPTIGINGSHLLGASLLLLLASLLFALL
jgi:hypothetical protein